MVVSKPVSRPTRLSPSDLASRSPAEGERVEIAGRVLSARLADVTVGDAFASAPVAFKQPPAVAVGDLIVAAASIRAGQLVDGGLVEVHRPLSPLPLRETERLGAGGVGEALMARAAVLRELRSYFRDEGFLEVETPAIVPSPGLDLHLDAFDVPDQGHLITSPEYQMKRLLAGGVPRCFQLARCFRRGEVGRRHNPEFTMLEWYRSFASVEAVIDDTEAIVRLAARTLGAWPTLTVGDVRIDLEPPFERLSVGDAFARWTDLSRDEAIDLATSDEDRFFRLLVETVEPALASATRPVFLVDYPAPFASLARLSPRDPRVAERFELYVGGVELCNGFGELTDAHEQRARLLHDQEARRAAGKPVYPIDERFLAALEEGMPPAGGNALGFDRLIAVCLGTDDIHGVAAFPVSWL